MAKRRLDDSVSIPVLYLEFCPPKVIENCIHSEIYSIPLGEFETLLTGTFVFVLNSVGVSASLHRKSSQGPIRRIELEVCVDSLIRWVEKLLHNPYKQVIANVGWLKGIQDVLESLDKGSDSPMEGLLSPSEQLQDDISLNLDLDKLWNGEEGGAEIV